MLTGGRASPPHNYYISFSTQLQLQQGGDQQGAEIMSNTT
jgi:hypothetical protein